MPKRFFKFVFRVVAGSAAWDMVKDHIWPWFVANVKGILASIMATITGFLATLSDVPLVYGFVATLLAIMATIWIFNGLQHQRNGITEHGRRGSGASGGNPASFNVQMIRSTIQTVELTGLNASDPFIIVRLLVSQVSGKRMVINGVHGSMNCNGELCVTPPQLTASVEFSDSTNDRRNCDIRQQITAGMADKLKADLAPEDGILSFGLNLGLSGITGDGVEFDEAWLTERDGILRGPVLFDEEHQGELREMFRWGVIIAHQNNYSTLGVRKPH